MRRFYLLAVAALLSGTHVAAGAEIDVLSAGAVSKALTVFAAEYKQNTGIDVHLTFGNVGQIEDRLKAGDAADVVILSASALGDLAKGGALVADSAQPLGRVGMGVAVRAGAPAPKIATTQAFKAALLAAPSIAYSDPAGGGSSGVFFDDLIQKLGIATQVRAKAVLIRGGSAADPVVAGKAAMAVQNSSELIGIPGIRYVGPFPAADQNYITYSAAIYMPSVQQPAAGAFIRLLTQPVAAKTWHAAGIEPPAAP
ncbi:MAG TPA: substrate-binding domain-containing protein [Stellaceae bacterium]|jgi:molybdate transport system substrate-binding protein